MGSVRKKISCRRISRVKKLLQGTTWRKIIPTLEKKILFMVYNAEKKSYTVVCQQKILSPDRGLGKKNFHTNQITHTLPHSPCPPLQMVRPLLIKVIQVIKHYPVQKILPVYTIPLSTEPHKPLNSGCKKYPPTSPPAKSRLECSTSGRKPFKLKVFRNVTQSVGSLFVAECKDIYISLSVESLEQFTNVLHVPLHTSRGHKEKVT